MREGTNPLFYLSLFMFLQHVIKLSQVAGRSNSEAQVTDFEDRRIMGHDEKCRKASAEKNAAMALTVDVNQ